MPELWDVTFIDSKTGKTGFMVGTQGDVQNRIRNGALILRQTLSSTRLPPSKTITEMLGYARRMREAPAYLGGSFQFVTNWPVEVVEGKPKPTGEVKTYTFAEKHGKVKRVS